MTDVRFIKNFLRHAVFLDETIPEAFIPHLKIKQNGGDYIFAYLHKKIVRGNWKDHEGFPIKKQFYDNNILACCVSIRTIAAACGFGDQRVQKLLKEMEELGWIKRFNNYTKKHQTVYALGTYKKEWSDKLKAYKYSESMYKDQVMDQALGLDTIDINTNNDYDFDSLYQGNVKDYFEK